MFFPEKITAIRTTDRVLEVGPGGNPHPRSDVFLEKNFPEKDAREQRGHAKQLATDKEVRYYEGGRFPFADNAFDYVICSQVLEHVPAEEVAEFVSELRRVAPRGYLEFPTVYYDYIYNFPPHVTLLLYKDGKISYLPKKASNLGQFREIQQFFYENATAMHAALTETLKPYFFQGFEWEGEIIAEKADGIGQLCHESLGSIGQVPTKTKTWIGKVRGKGLRQTSFFPESPPLDVKHTSLGKTMLRRLGGARIKRQLSLLKTYFLYLRQFKRFQATDGSRFAVRKKDRCFHHADREKKTSFDKHYTYHTAWAARKLQSLAPDEHVDISSLTYFSTILSAFFPVRFYDYRPAEIHLGNFSCNHADVTQLQFADNSLQSLSCMHVVEHVGLGRYGEPIDVDGDLKAMAELRRVVAQNGYLLFVVPVGEAKIVFNAHRIYSYEQVLSHFPDFSLIEFSLVPDSPRTGLVENATREQADAQSYGCGCFLFQKKGETE